MQSLNNYLPTFLIFLGLGLLTLEVAVLGFSVLILFFIGLACLLTALLMLANVIPDTLAGSLLGTGLLSLVIAVVLWKPLKRMQDNIDSKPVNSDLIGHRFVLDSNVSPSLPGQTRFSGITWTVTAESEIEKGCTVEIIDTAAGTLTVREVKS